jgi:hypothetical protein
MPSGARHVDGKKFPNDRFGAVFFQPFYAGQTFGLGQLNPLTALVHSDRVSKVSRYRKLSAANAARVYEAIMEPDSTLAFMAASIVESIENYRDIAGFDISKNPGVTATLYNVGNSAKRARDWPTPTGNAQTADKGGSCLLRITTDGWSIITKTSCAK